MVYLFVMNSELSKERWAADNSTDECVQCAAKFNIVTRRHHCRICGQIFCNKCTTNKVAVQTGLVRACHKCFIEYQNQISFLQMKNECEQFAEIEIACTELPGKANNPIVGVYEWERDQSNRIYRGQTEPVQSSNPKFVRKMLVKLDGIDDSLHNLEFSVYDFDTPGAKSDFLGLAIVTVTQLMSKSRHDLILQSDKNKAINNAKSHIILQVKRHSQVSEKPDKKSERKLQIENLRRQWKSTPHMFSPKGKESTRPTIRFKLGKTENIDTAPMAYDGNTSFIIKNLNISTKCIEIVNTTPTIEDLTGWTLVDQEHPDKYLRFPNISVEARGKIIVLVRNTKDTTKSDDIDVVWNESSLFATTTNTIELVDPVGIVRSFRPIGHQPPKSIIASKDSHIHVHPASSVSTQNSSIKEKLPSPIDHLKSPPHGVFKINMENNKCIVTNSSPDSQNPLAWTLQIKEKPKYYFRIPSMNDIAPQHSFNLWIIGTGQSKPSSDGIDLYWEQSGFGGQVTLQLLDPVGIIRSFTMAKLSGSMVGSSDHSQSKPEEEKVQRKEKGPIQIVPSIFGLFSASPGNQSFEVMNRSGSTASMDGWTLRIEHGGAKTQFFIYVVSILAHQKITINVSKSVLFSNKPTAWLLFDPLGNAASRLDQNGERQPIELQQEDAKHEVVDNDAECDSFFSITECANNLIHVCNKGEQPSGLVGWKLRIKSNPQNLFTFPDIGKINVDETVTVKIGATNQGGVNPKQEIPWLYTQQIVKDAVELLDSNDEIQAMRRFR